MSQGKITVPSIDDREDMQFANEAFDVLGFTEVLSVCFFFDQKANCITIKLLSLGGKVQCVQEHGVHDAHGKHDQGFCARGQRGTG